MPRSSESFSCERCFEGLGVPEFLKHGKLSANKNSSKKKNSMKIRKDTAKQQTNGNKSCVGFTASSRHDASTCGPVPWYMLPIFAGVTPMLGLIATFTLAKTNCHVEKWILPYVSYTGTRFPELMYFGLLLNIEGFFGIVIVFLAWRYYKHLGESGKLNHATLVVGSISCFGVIIVGNFPVLYSKFPHYLGASMAFIMGTLYTILTAVLSRRTSYSSNIKNIHRVKVCRIILAFIMSVSLVSLIIFAGFKSVAEKKEKVIDDTLLLQKVNGSCLEYPNSSRYFDLFGSLVEWILTIGILICLGLYSCEFKAFNSVKIVLKKCNGQVLEMKQQNGIFDNDLYKEIGNNCNRLDTVVDTSKTSCEDSLSNYDENNSFSIVNEKKIESNSPMIPKKPEES